MLEGVQVTPGSVFRSPERPGAEVLGTFRAVGSANVAAALGGPLATRCLLDAQAIPRASGTGVVAGQALTVWHPPGSNGMLVRALEESAPGDVFIICGPREVAQWGDIATALSINAGISGAIVDGAARDVERIRAMGFSLWATRIFGGQGFRKDLGYVNVPVVVGGLYIRPGDVVVADSDGILAVPRRLVAEAFTLAAERERQEEAAGRAALGGVPPPVSFEVRASLVDSFTGSITPMDVTWDEFAASPAVSKSL